MAILSSSIDPRQVGPLGMRNNKKTVIRPDYGTYFCGQTIMFGDDDGKYKVASGSNDSRGAGVSLEEKTVSATDPTLTILQGMVVREYHSANPPTAKDVGKLCYIRDDLTVNMSSSYRSSNIAGRIVGLTNDSKCVVEFDLLNIPSGSSV